jgi:8-oxo-dGTP pyrophosphatase MutT (NUDIX family)
MTMTSWRILASRCLLERRWLTLHEQHVRLPTGAEIEEFHLIESPDWVAVLALTPAGQLVMVEQYRHGARQSSLELPAGVIDAGETPADAARRELAEETGFSPAELTPLSTVFPEPARHTNRAHFFFATGAEKRAEQRLDEGENLSVRLISPRGVLEAIESGALVHGAHVGAILLAMHRGLL